MFFLFAIKPATGYFYKPHIILTALRECSSPQIQKTPTPCKQRNLQWVTKHNYIGCLIVPESI